MDNPNKRPHTKRIIKYKYNNNNPIKCSLCKRMGYHEVYLSTYVSVTSNLCDKHFQQFQNEVNGIIVVKNV